MAYCKGEENSPSGGIRWVPVGVLSCSGHQWYVVVAPETYQQVAVFQNKKVTQLVRTVIKKGGTELLLVCARHCHAHFIQSISLNLHDNSMR